MELIMLFMFQFMEQWTNNACALMQTQIPKKKYLKMFSWVFVHDFFSIEFLCSFDIFLNFLFNQNVLYSKVIKF
jgi:hypothetical protein